MWPVRLTEAESGAEVVDQVGLLLDGSKQGLVDGLLVGNTVLRGLLLLFDRQYYPTIGTSVQLTSGASPCLKKASSPDFLVALSLVK